MKITLSFAERAILANQSKILALLDPAEAKSHERNATILENGYEGLYTEVFSNVDTNIVGHAEAKETREILSMFYTISLAMNKLASKGNITLPKSGLEFEGFDENNDSHYHYANFLVEKMGYYREHAENGIPNSHTQSSLPRYKRMLEYYKKAIEKKGLDHLELEDLQHLSEIV